MSIHGRYSHSKNNKFNVQLAGGARDLLNGSCFERSLGSLALPPAQILRRAALYALLFSLERSQQPRSEHFSLGHMRDFTQRL
jgi:hypothetical protein